MNRSVLQGAFDLCEHLIDNGIGAIIAGGCARDLFFGVTPKDIDIICAGVDPETVSRALDAMHLQYTKFPKYHTGSDSDRLQGVWKLEGSNIDVILYETGSVIDAVEKFDYNLNQFIISGIHRGLEEATVRYIGTEHWSKLVRLRDDARGPRAAKMEQKWIDLAYRKPHETREVKVVDVSV